METGKESTSYSLYCKGRTLLRSGNVSLARKLLLRSFKLDPHCKTALLLADSAIALDERVPAVEFIAEAYRLQSTSNEAATRFAETLLDSGNVIEATRIIDDVLRRSPTYGPAQLVRRQLTSS